jgi:hypothetical protein
MSQRIQIKNKAQVEQVFSKKLAAEILAFGGRGGHSQAKPRHITFYAAKPSYYLNDGDTLRFLAVSVAEQKILAEHYAGSSDTAYWHQGEQLSEGSKAPGDAVLAIVHYWNGKNMSWTIDVISSHLTPTINA